MSIGSRRHAWLCALPLLAVGAASAVRADEVSAQKIIDGFEKNFGVHPGQRRNHTKGTCAAGYFVGTREAAALSRSALFSGEKIPVVARFSLSGGNPKIADNTRGGRGMALEFKLPGGKLQHMTMINLPIFAAATPQSFYESVLAARPDPKTGKPDPEKVKAYRASHPDAKAQAEFVASHNPPPSYANAAYFGIHTFKFAGPDQQTRLVRWRFVPKDGEKALSDAEMTSAPSDFLEPALLERAKRGPIEWDMIVTLGEPGDTETDPTLAWPEQRKQVRAGTLTLTEATPQKGAACEGINFDPLVMSEGIAASSDPVLQFRSPAYAVSFGKRREGK